jgi:hypothetical protein
MGRRAGTARGASLPGVLAGVISAAVIVTGLSSAYAASFTAQVVPAAVSAAPRSPLEQAAVPASAVRLLLERDQVATSWADPHRPDLVDVSSPPTSRVTVSVRPAGPADPAATVTVRACSVAWTAEGRCAGRSWQLLSAASMAAVTSGVDLGPGTAVPTHLRVTATAGAALVFSSR